MLCSNVMKSKGQILNVGDMPFLLIVHIKGHLDLFFLGTEIFPICFYLPVKNEWLRAKPYERLKVASDIFNIFTASDLNTRIPYLRNKSHTLPTHTWTVRNGLLCSIVKQLTCGFSNMVTDTEESLCTPECLWWDNIFSHLDFRGVRGYSVHMWE